MSRLLLLGPLVVFGVAGVCLIVLFNQPSDGSAFRENMVPELIGFCLEGFFLVGLFTFFQKRREVEQRKALKLSLRSALRDFLSHLDLAFLEPDAEPQPSRVLERDPQAVERYLNRLRNIEMDVKYLAALKTVAKRDLALMHDLISVSVQLSAEHMRWWIAIVDAVRELRDAEDRATAEHALYLFLVNLREFDRLAFK